MPGAWERLAVLTAQHLQLSQPAERGGAVSRRSAEHPAKRGVRLAKPPCAREHPSASQRVFGGGDDHRVDAPRRLHVPQGERGVPLRQGAIGQSQVGTDVRAVRRDRSLKSGDRIGTALGGDTHRGDVEPCLTGRGAASHLFSELEASSIGRHAWR
jgi:hypothetical protein